MADSEEIKQYLADATETAGEMGVTVAELLAQRCLSYADAARQLRSERDHYRASLYGRYRAS
jgi:hypothetical protein